MEEINKIKEQNLLAKITNIYIFVMVVLFPLCVDSTGFFKILECKYSYFLGINVIYIFTIIVILMYFKMFRNTNFFKHLKLSNIQKVAIVFLVVNVVSTLLSPFLKKYNLFVGVGRAEGLITITLYILSFLNISLFGKFEKKYILYFSISSLMVNIISILQYIGFNPLNMYQDGIGTHNVSFIGTIGNVDFVSAYYTIVLTISMAAFIFINDDKKYIKFIHLASVYTGFFIFEVLDVRSGTLAFGVILAIVLPLIVTNSKRFAKLLIITAFILLGYATNIVLNPVFHYSLGKIVLEIQFPLIAIILNVCILSFLILAYILYKRDFDFSNYKKMVKLYYIILAILILSFVAVLYFVDFDLGFLHEIHEILHGNFNDEFGTYRLFLWKRSIKLIKDYPLLGTGNDTFAVRFMTKYAKDVADLGELTINDTAANVYLTMLVNIGIVGLLVYLIFISLQIKNSFKNLNKETTVLLIAFVCYLIQDLFNLWVVVVTPIFWILMAILYISCNKESKSIKEVL